MYFIYKIDELFIDISPLGGFGGPEMTEILFVAPFYVLSTLIHLAICISLGMIVTRFACIVHRLESSKSPTKCVSAASCRAVTVAGTTQKSVLKSCKISLTSHWKGNFLMSNSVPFWYLLSKCNCSRAVSSFLLW